MVIGMVDNGAYDAHSCEETTDWGFDKEGF